MSKQTFVHPNGLPDILPEDHTYFTFIKKVVRHRCRQSGYRRITTPVFESTKLFETALGESSPVIQNKLFSFEREKEAYSLRPDLVPGMIRSYIEHDFRKLPQPVELYAIEQVYKFADAHNGKVDSDEKLNQYTDFAVEIIGETDLAMDAQIIYLGHKILKDLGIIGRVDLETNHLGCPKCISKYMEDLKNFYYGKKHALCDSCKELLKKNPLRLLSCKNEDCEILAKLAPKFEDNYCKDCKTYKKEVRAFFDELKIEYSENSFFLGDAEYYDRTIFRFIDKETGKTVLMGGRQNGLVEKLGGPSLPAVGFSANFEILVEIMKAENITIKSKDTVDVFVAQLGVEAKKKCMSLMMKLREIGVHTIGALGKGSMKEQLALAEKFNAKWAILMGQIEVLEGIAIIRNMDAGSQEIVRYEDLMEEIIQRLGEENLDRYSVGVEETVYQGDDEIIGEEYAELVE